MLREPAQPYPLRQKNSSRHRLLLPACDAARLKEFFDGGGDFHAVRLDREVACIQELNLRIRQIFSKRLSSGENEEWIILAPDRQQRRFRSPKIVLKLRIKLHIRCVVQEQIELNLFVSRALQQ